MVDTDLIPKKAESINNLESPIANSKIEEYLASCELILTATDDTEDTNIGVERIKISTCTNRDVEINCFDTPPGENAIETILLFAFDSPAVNKSTIPVGYTVCVAKKYNCDHIFFGRMLLCEDKILYDNFYSIWIIVGIPEGTDAAPPWYRSC